MKKDFNEIKADSAAIRKRQLEMIRQYERMADAKYIKNHWDLAVLRINNFSKLGVISPDEARQLRDISKKMKDIKTKMIQRLNTPLI